MSLAQPIKSVGCCFTWKNPSWPLPPVFSYPGTKFVSGHILNMLFKQPIPSYPATQRHWKRCRSSLWISWKDFDMSRMKQLSNSLFILSYTPANPWRSNIDVQDYPWSSGIPHGVHLRTSDPQRTTRSRLQVPPTAMLYAPSPIRLHNSSCPIFEQSAGRDSQRIRTE